MFFQNSPETLVESVEFRSAESIRRRLGHLFVSPWKAPECQDWARFQVGVQCRKSPEQLKRILGWDKPESAIARAGRWSGAIVGKSVRLFRRVQDPEAHAKSVSTEALRTASPGELVTTNGPGPKMESLNGPLLAWELENYYYGNFCRVYVNPPDGPAVDLTPREGVSVLALAKNHPFRKIYYLQTGGSEGDRLKKNVSAEASIAGAIVAVPYPRTTETTESSGGLYSLPVWEQFREDCSAIFKDAVVLRMSVDAVSWERAIEKLEDFPCCRLLLLECRNPSEYLGPLLTEIRSRHFSPCLDLARFNSFRESGNTSPRDLFSLACTRSGLKVNSNGNGVGRTR
jgi:hypothetical protein